jgi:hypothetical protein
MSESVLLLLGALTAFLVGCVLAKLMLPTLWAPLFRDRKENVLHRHAEYASCVAGRNKLTARIEDANASYSKAEREFLEVYVASAKSNAPVAIGVNQLPPQQLPSYSLTDRVKALVDELNVSAADIANARTAYNSAARDYNDALNGFTYKIFYLAGGETFSRARYAPSDEGALKSGFDPFEDAASARDA